MNQFGTLFRVEILGESHGPAVGVIVDGCPPGLPLSAADFETARDRLKELSEQRDAANRQAPLPSRLARRRANKNIESGSQQYRADAE